MGAKAADDDHIPMIRSVIFIGLGQIETSETQVAQNMKLLYQLARHSAATTGHYPGQGTATHDGFGEE